MIPNDQPARKDMIKRMISYLINDEVYNTLTGWEQEFIHSIDYQFDAKKDLSNKQCEILERIYDK